MWDRPLSGEEIRKMAECCSDPQGNYVSWEVGWTLQNVNSYETPRENLCKKEVSAEYFWFPARGFTTAMYLCDALGTKLPSAVDMNEADVIHEVAAVLFPNQALCYTDYWTSATDAKEDGVWMEYNSPLVGQIAWHPEEPNGLVYENCAVLNGRGISDIDCKTNYKCIVCAFNDQQRFSLLGTCESELRNVYFTAFQPNIGELLFIGYGAYHIRQVEAGGWIWVNVVQNFTIAHMEEHDAGYPMGRRFWHLNYPVCGQKPGGRRLLLLTPCALNQFTCDDGTCVPLEYRCDLKYDCRDNTDELECHLVAFPKDYQKHLPPRTVSAEGASLPIILNVNIESMTVKTMEMIMEISYRLELTWVDNRLLYQNLKVNNTLNILPFTTMKSLWTPQVSFINTRDNQHTLMDEDATMLVDRWEDAIRRDEAAPAEGKSATRGTTGTSRGWRCSYLLVD